MESVLYEIYDQETGARIGNLVKTRRAAARKVTIIYKKTGKYPDYRTVRTESNTQED